MDSSITDLKTFSYTYFHMPRTWKCHCVIWIMEQLLLKEETVLDRIKEDISRFLKNLLRSANFWKLLYTNIVYQYDRFMSVTELLQLRNNLKTCFRRLLLQWIILISILMYTIKKTGGASTGPSFHPNLLWNCSPAPAFMFFLTWEHASLKTTCSLHRLGHQSLELGLQSYTETSFLNSKEPSLLDISFK